MGRKPAPNQPDEYRKLTLPERKEHVLSRMRGGSRIVDICRTLRINDNTIYNWRSHDEAFRAKFDQAKAIGAEARKIAKAADDQAIYDPAEWADVVPPPIREFRTEFIGRPTPDHLGEVIDAWEDRTNRYVICLLPPGAGKDTTAGDIVLHATVDRSKRVAWIMESAGFSRRRLGRLEGYYWDPRAYVAPTGPGCVEPTRRMFDEFGPFRGDKEMVYPDGTKVPQPRWTQNEIYFLGRDNEADPNLWATGIGGATYGARIDIGVVSDPFTKENQAQPAMRESQIDWIMGTFLSRLDTKGRALFLGTRVGEWDNWDRLIEELAGESPVLYSAGHTTKYANGVAVVQIPAIQVDEDGNDRSYWPELFGLRSYLTPAEVSYPTDDTPKAYLDEIDDDEHMRLAREGWTRIDGLYGIRGTSPASMKWFQTAYQQQPPTGDEGEFPLGLLDSCDDYTRTYGQWTPGSTLVLGIDPARTGGAAWVLWEWDGETIGLVDYFFGTNIGVGGLREKLLVDPITRFKPRYAVYESNREASVLEHPEVRDAVRGAKTQLRGRPTTMMNRGVGELRVAAMSLDMASGLIRWPAATQEDRHRTDQIKEQFLNWDQREKIRRVNSQIRLHAPDDIAMAAWVGWVKLKEVIGAASSRQLPTRKVAAAIARNWGYQATIPTVERPAAHTDLAALYYGTTE